MNSNLSENDIAAIIVNTALEIHKRLGPGLFESVFIAVLAHELRHKHKLLVETQVAIPVYWDDVKLDIGFRADLIVERKVIVEGKSIENILPVHCKQVLTYLRLTGLKLGLLINFNVELLKTGIKRIVNGL